MIGIGLDNGVFLNKPTSVIPFYVKVDSWASSEDSVEICYWRKCWGIRDEILSLFPEADSNDSCLKLTPEHIRAIRKIIRSFMNKEKWEEESNSIWTYDEIRPRLIKHWVALWWLERYLRKNPDAEAYFYDSW